jgi:hypothetical protein
MLMVVGLMLLASAAAAQTSVSFPTEDGGLIYADLYGTGDQGVVLAHGARFNKERWNKQAYSNRRDFESWLSISAVTVNRMARETLTR